MNNNNNNERDAKKKEDNRRYYASRYLADKEKRKSGDKEALKKHEDRLKRKREYGRMKRATEREEAWNLWHKDLHELTDKEVEKVTKYMDKQSRKKKAAQKSRIKQKTVDMTDIENEDDGKIQIIGLLDSSKGKSVDNAIKIEDDYTYKIPAHKKEEDRKRIQEILNSYEKRRDPSNFDLTEEELNKINERRKEQREYGRNGLGGTMHDTAPNPQIEMSYAFYRNQTEFAVPTKRLFLREGWVCVGNKWKCTVCQEETTTKPFCSEILEMSCCGAKYCVTCFRDLQRSFNRCLICQHTFGEY